LNLKEVALQLGISIHTAARHTRNAYLKLGLHDRGALVRHFAPPNVTAVRDTLTGSMWTTSTKN
jgi:DNA-binding NarL/FixJ family response regulator